METNKAKRRAGRGVTAGVGISVAVVLSVSWDPQNTLISVSQTVELGILQAVLQSICRF